MRDHRWRWAGLLALVALLATGCDGLGRGLGELFGTILLILAVAFLAAVVVLTAPMVMLVLVSHREGAGVGPAAVLFAYSGLYLAGCLWASGLFLFVGVLPALGLGAATRRLVLHGLDKPLLAALCGLLVAASYVPVAALSAWVTHSWPFADRSKELEPIPPLTPAPTLRPLGSPDAGVGRASEPMLTQAATGFIDACGRRADGTVVCTRGFDRRLVPGIDDAIAVRASETRACAIRAGGAVSCWELRRMEPEVVPSLAGVTELVLDREQIYALTGDATVVGSPAAAPAGIGRAVRLAARLGRVCAALEGGGVSCWRAGDARAEPWRAARAATDVAIDGLGRCVLEPGGVVRCEGMARLERVELPAAATELATGANQVCALLVDRRVFCWHVSYAAYVPSEAVALAGAERLVSGNAVCASYGDRRPTCLRDSMAPDRSVDSL